MTAVSKAAAAATAASTPPVYKCALPECDKTNAVATLQLCSACQEKLPTRYCSLEHQRADWKRHKSECFRAARVPITVAHLNPVAVRSFVAQYGSRILNAFLNEINK